MRSHRNIVGVSHRRDLLELRDAASSRNVGLNNAHSLLLQQFTKAMTAKDPLTRGKRNVNGALYLDHGGDVLRWHGLLVKEKTVGFQGANNLDRRLSVPAAVDVDRNVIVRPPGLPHRFDLHDGASQLLSRNLAIVRARRERIEFAP